MLGRLRMSVDECLKAFQELLQKIWAHPRAFFLPFIPRDKYNDIVLEEELKRLVRQKSPLDSSDMKFMQPIEDMCRT